MSCTAAHLRSRLLNIVSLSDMIEGSYRSWDLYTTGQQVDGLQQQPPHQKKKKTVFIKRKWNHVFSRATILSFHPVLLVISLERDRNFGVLVRDQTSIFVEDGMLHTHMWEEIIWNVGWELRCAYHETGEHFSHGM